MNRHSFLIRSLAVAAGFTLCGAETVLRMLPGELSAEEMLNGAYPFPPSPEVPVTYDASGFAAERVSKVPAPGVHPRILLSPEDLPDLRRRLKETETGRALHATLKSRTDGALRDPKQWSSKLYDRLAAGDEAGVMALVEEQGGFPRGIGHYQPWIYAIVMEAFDAMISEDEVKGRRAATAIATYASLIRPNLEKVLSGPMNDDVWRAKTSGPVTGVGGGDQGMREGVGGHLLGYAYDFGYNFMTDAQRATVRGVISTATKGRLWMGARLPHHFRNWNWIALGLQQPLLALAIEGEEGYDERVYKLGVEVARDYLTYGISPNGQSTEAVGYTQFGLVWANPFYVAAVRRGDNLLAHSHHRAMLDWYLQSMEPSMDQFTSHGDGGDGPPTIWTLAMWRYFFPQDPKADFLWQCFSTKSEGTPLAANALDVKSDDATKHLPVPDKFSPFAGNFHIIEPMLWADDAMRDDAGKPVDYRDGAKLGLPTMAFDPIRGSLNARSGWHRDAVTMQFECRVDSVGASHEHADRGNFTLFAHGRSWAKDNFRSVETRHHNNVLIDGLGQGYWPGPGEWVSHEEKGTLVFASADAKEAYNWWWPKQIKNEKQDFVRFKFPRWASYAGEAAQFQREYAGVSIEQDTRPAVVAFWKGFEKTDPRLWDEDSWPVRLSHNPVRRAFRSVVFQRGEHPWLLVVDDIQKDEKERLYEWLMQTGMNTEMMSMAGNDIILGDASVARSAAGEPKPAKGDRQLLVRLLELGNPADPHLYTSRPSCRLETFERKDTLLPEAATGALSGSRTFGLDKRLVLASRSVAPDFKILLFPHRHGDALPTTSWNETRSELVIEIKGEKTTLGLEKSEAGRTVISPK
jgi:hypothetical protein